MQEKNTTVQFTVQQMDSNFGPCSLVAQLYSINGHPELPLPCTIYGRNLSTENISIWGITPTRYLKNLKSYRFLERADSR